MVFSSEEISITTTQTSHGIANVMKREQIAMSRKTAILSHDIKYVHRPKSILEADISNCVKLKDMYPIF